MFLKNIKINNFRSIQKASVDFENGMNILIGKNGVGKSNLLNFINGNVESIRNIIDSRIGSDTAMNFEYTLNDLLTTGINELRVDIDRQRVLESDKITSFNLIKLSHLENGNFIFKDQIFNNRLSDLEENKTLYEYRKSLFSFEHIPKTYIQFQIPEASTWLHSSVRYEIEGDLHINNNSDKNELSFLLDLEYDIEFGLLNFIHNDKKYEIINEISLHEIKSKIYQIFETNIRNLEIDKHLKANAFIDDIRLKSNINIFHAAGKIYIENLFLEFNVDNSWVPWSYLSDGTRRLFYLISECLSLGEGGILLIEEPELGIHPHQLFSLMNFLKEQSETKQIIISTHSPIVLDVLSPDELNRITIVKLGDKGTEFHKLYNEQIEKAKLYMSEEGDLSYYWLHSDLEDEE